MLSKCDDEFVFGAGSLWASEHDVVGANLEWQHTCWCPTPVQAIDRDLGGRAAGDGCASTIPGDEIDDCAFGFACFEGDCAVVIHVEIPVANPDLVGSCIEWKARDGRQRVEFAIQEQCTWRVAIQGELAISSLLLKRPGGESCTC